MCSYLLEESATSENFNEVGYLEVNPDVAAAVARGVFKTGREHFELYGINEGRSVRHHGSRITEAKKRKLDRIKPVLRDDMPYTSHEEHFDFLTDELKVKFNVTSTENVSSHKYDEQTINLIEKHTKGLLVDVGAGRRPVYYDNVVNFEIELFDTTDVRGVGERLPFKDESIDAVISLAVLEHVKDPFLCASEISRILKPGGDLYCCAPFLQPVHGYPNHYYNMTHQGLRNLFESYLEIEQISVSDNLLPVWSLTWILSSWAAGLQGEAREEFLNLKVAELMDPGDKYLHRQFVSDLSEEKNLELASGYALLAHKPE